MSAGALKPASGSVATDAEEDDSALELYRMVEKSLRLVELSTEDTQREIEGVKRQLALLADAPSAVIGASEQPIRTKATGGLKKSYGFY